MRSSWMPPKHQRYRWPLSASNVSGMIPRPPDSSTCMPDQPARSSLSEISASSVMHHSSQPPSSSRATLLIRPMGPAKIAPSRSFLEGWETAKKYL